MRRWWALGLLLLFLAPAWAGEQVDLTSPDQASAGTPSYYIVRSDMDWEGVRVTIYLSSSSGLRKTITITGADATAYMKAANKRDSSVISLQKWTLNQLITKGYLSGTVSGTPD